MLTYLAALFILFLIAAILYGFGIVLRKPPSKDDLQTASCFLCGKKYNLSILTLREIGDTKVVHFCPQCIRNLHADMTSRSSTSSPSS